MRESIPESGAKPLGCARTVATGREWQRRRNFRWIFNQVITHRDGDAALGELPLEIGEVREVPHQVSRRRSARRRRPGVSRTPEADFLVHLALGNLLSREVDQRRPYLLRKEDKGSSRVTRGY